MLRSGITRPARALLLSATGNAATRTPFRGVAQLYRALQGGA